MLMYPGIRAPLLRVQITPKSELKRIFNYKGHNDLGIGGLKFYILCI
jgi:hypothetical protein